VKLSIRCLASLAAAAIVGLSLSAAQASILAPGDTAVPNAFSSPTGAVLASSVATGVTGGGDVGTLLTEVVQDTPGGMLDFLYQWTAGANNLDDFSLASAIRFGAGSVDVGYIAGSLTADLIAAGFAAPSGATIPIPTQVHRSAPSGNTIDWFFGNLGDASSYTFNPGDKTVILEIKTDANSYYDGMAGIQDGTTVSLPAFSPVPEPATLIVWSLLGAGSWLGVRVWRRRGAGLAAPIACQSWLPENRQAIRELIARGTPR
jgi:hypothetical protein